MGEQSRQDITEDAEVRIDVEGSVLASANKRAEYVEISPEDWGEDDEITVRFRYGRPALSSLKSITLEQFRAQFDPMAPVYLETDGACSATPGPGGWGSVLAPGNIYTMQHGGNAVTTNNQMELQALL
jgi:hypothetical protein